MTFTETLRQNGRTTGELVKFTRSGPIRPSADHLRLIYQPSDLTAIATGGASTGARNSRVETGSSDLSTGAEAVTGAVIPSTSIISVLAGCCFWKRRKYCNDEARVDGVVT